MKKLLTLGILLVACAVSMGQTHGTGGLRPGTQPARFQDLAEDYTNATATIPDGRSRFYIRFDDGTASQYYNGHVAAFLVRGIPVTLAIDPSQIDTGTGVTTGRMTWTQIRDLMALASEYGTSLDFWVHREFAATDDTYAEFVSKLSYGSIVDSIGITPSTFLLGGTNDSKLAAIPRETYLKTIAKETGYKYFIGNGTSWSTNSYSGLYPNDVAVTTKTSLDTWTMGVRPGQCTDPYAMIGGGFSDLGNTFVERKDSPTGVLDWNIQDEGGSADYVGVWGKSWWGNVTINLGGNLWWAQVMHDSLRADSAGSEFDIGDGSGSVTHEGHYSPVHTAWACSSLVANDIAVAITGTQYNSGMLRYYAPGTDLIANRGMNVPQYVVADTVGIMEFAAPQGLGTAGCQQVSWTNWKALAVIGRQEDDNGTNGKYSRASGRHPSAVMGDSVTGAFGRAGGAISRPSGGNFYDRYYLSWGGLRPGNYEFSFWFWDDSAAYITQNSTAIWASRIGWDTRDNFLDFQAYTSRDTVVVYREMGTSPSFVNWGPLPAGTQSQWTKVVMYFVIPSQPGGVEVSGTPTYFGEGSQAWDPWSETSWKSDWSWTVGMYLSMGHSDCIVSDFKFIYNPLRE